SEQAVADDARPGDGTGNSADDQAGPPVRVAASVAVVSSPAIIVVAMMVMTGGGVGRHAEPGGGRGNQCRDGGEGGKAAHFARSSRLFQVFNYRAARRFPIAAR